MAIETLGIGLIKAIPSIVRDTRRLAVEFRKWREKKRLRRPPMVKFLDRVLVQMHEIVEDYENMLLTLERGLQSEAKTRKALLEFQKSHDRLIFERARLFAELSHVIKSGNPAPVRAFFRSLLRILDARELALAHRRLRGTRLPSMCKRRSNNPSLKRPDLPVAPE